jgi:hypothetical protein
MHDGWIDGWMDGEMDQYTGIQKLLKITNDESSLIS